MNRCRTDVEVVGPGFEFGVAYRWGFVKGMFEQFLVTKMAEAQTIAAQFANKGGDLTASLVAWVDGVVQAPKVVTGLRLEDMENFQDKFDAWGAELRNESRRMRKEGDKGKHGGRRK